MKKVVKNSLLISMGLFMGLTASSYGALEKITVFKDNVTSIFIEGKKLQTSSDVINHKGTLYVPLRVVSENMNMNVSYDKSNKTVNIAKKPLSKEEELAKKAQIHEEAVAEKETVEDSKDHDNVFAVRGKIVNIVDSGIKFVATDINKPFNKILENMDDNHVDIVDKDFMDAISEFGNKNAEVEALVAKKIANDIDNVILDDLKKNSITKKEEATVETSVEELDNIIYECTCDSKYKC